MSNPINRQPNRPVNNTSSSNEAAYREGYSTGRDSERLLQEDRYVARESNSTASGLMMGLTLAVLAALAGGTVYFLSQRQEPTRQSTPSTQIIPVPVPNSTQSQPQTPNSKKETTIIERTIDKTRDIVPVPVQPEAAPSNKESSKDSSTSAPQINLTVPSTSQQPTESKDTPAQDSNPSAAPESSSSKP